MWDLNDLNAPDSEAVQAEREIWEDIAQANAPLATESEAHAEWHRNAGVPMGTPGCPQDACHPDEHNDDCDRCGKVRELYHNEKTGLALCDECDRITDEVEALVPVVGEVRFKRLHNDAWGVTGPSALLREGAAVAVTKRDGTTSTVTVNRVLWSGDGKAICTIRR